MIRPMREEDLKQAADLEKRYFSLPWSEKTLRESLERQEYVFLVAEEEGQIAGYAGLLQVMEEGDITNVVVDESCRGRGLGRGLVSRLLEEGKARGIRAFTLEVLVGNAGAIRLYEELGFRSEGVRKGFYDLPKEDALIMWKREDT